MTGKLFRLPRPTVSPRVRAKYCIGGRCRPVWGTSPVAQRALEVRASASMPATGTTSGLPLAEPIGARWFVCARCQAEVVVCNVCDRGRRYCGSECSSQARRASLRKAGRRYQSSNAGSVAHARRARSYRHRRRWPQQRPLPLPPPPNTVTHQPSQAMDGGDVLAAKLNEVAAQSKDCEAPRQWHCCWCARTGHSEVRRDFLGRGREPQHVAYWSRRGTPYGRSP
jgi:hypothetical protein